MAEVWRYHETRSITEVSPTATASILAGEGCRRRGRCSEESVFLTVKATPVCQIRASCAFSALGRGLVGGLLRSGGLAVGGRENAVRPRVRTSKGGHLKDTVRATSVLINGRPLKRVVCRIRRRGQRCMVALTRPSVRRDAVAHAFRRRSLVTIAPRGRLTTTTIAGGRATTTGSITAGLTREGSTAPACGREGGLPVIICRYGRTRARGKRASGPANSILMVLRGGASVLLF